MRNDILITEPVNVDSATTGATTVFTPSIRSWITTGVFLRCTAAANVSTVAIVTLGTNATAYDDIVSSVTLTGVTTSGLYANLSGMGNTARSVVATGTAIKLNINTAVTGATPSQTLQVYLTGYYV